MIGLEEAIKLISPATEGTEYMKIMDEQGRDAAHEKAERAKMLAVECMKKQIPTPPKGAKDEDGLCVRYECPACGGFLMQLTVHEARRMKFARRTPIRWPRFCECGQKLEWSGIGSAGD